MCLVRLVKLHKLRQWLGDVGASSDNNNVSQDLRLSKLLSTSAIAIIPWRAITLWRTVIAVLIPINSVQYISCVNSKCGGKTVVVYNIM